MEKPFEEIIKNFISSGDARLDAILKFTVEIDQMTAVLRRTILTDGSRRENDAEHFLAYRADGDAFQRLRRRNAEC